MKTCLVALASFHLLSSIVLAQPIIIDRDMTYKIGEYYKAYSNKPNVPVDVAGLLGKKGGPQFWDFSIGSKDDTLLYEYVDPKGTAIGAQFPKAKIAERKTTQSNGDQAWLLYEHVPNVGRTVYGAWNADELFLDPAKIFTVPVVDFPAQIKWNDTWNNLVTFTNDLDLGDVFAIRTIITSSFIADAYGIADLPNLGFGDVLRINQLDEIQLQLFTDDESGNGSYNNLGSPVYARFFYWIMPGRGIVATVASETTGSLEGNATPPPDNFARADYVIRMFETNRKATIPCEKPGSVSDLRITVDSQQGRALLKWTTTDCTSQYRVEYTDNYVPGAPWNILGSTTSNFMLDTDGSRPKARYYRVVSIR